MNTNDCCTEPGPGLNSLEDTLAYLLSQVPVITQTEQVDLQNAGKRVLAEALTSSISMPPWDNSAMDGYAVATADLAVEGEVNSLPISQRIPAGHTGTALKAGTAARIFTGAPVPEGADAVVIQERCEKESGCVKFSATVQPSDNIRYAGEAFKQGDEVIPAGTILQPQHIGVAASVGASLLTVVRKPKVAVFSTGDELIQPGGQLGDGQIFDSNKPTFIALLQSLGCDLIDLGHIPDSLQATTDALATASQNADLILTSGGVSVGEEDYVKAAVETQGQLSLWKVAIRPGKPLAFGTVNNVPVIGVPGNPVALFVTFTVFVRPFLLRMMSVTNYHAPSFKVPIGFDWQKPDKRREFMRVKMVQNENNINVLEPYPSRSSGILNSVSWADGLAVIPENTELKQGDLVEFWPFTGLL